MIKPSKITRDAMTADFVRSLLDYNGEIGEFRWKNRPNSMFTRERIGKVWNVRRAGKLAGALTANGYWHINVTNHLCLAHRLAWLIETGEWPRGLVDHINGNKIDNRFCNLRIATHSQNAANSRVAKNNSSGWKGVYKRGKRTWVAQIKAERIGKKIGSFDCPAAASFAYQIAADKLFGEFARAA